MTDDAWAPHADTFVDGHYRSLRGRVRLHVIHQHLLEWLPPPPATVVDVGGGAGNQSVPLAALGYELTIVEPSPAMLDRATARVAALPADVRRRVRLVRADAAGASAAAGGSTFDAVLCHGVLMYVDSPRPFLAALAGLAAPGAPVSVVAKNARVLAARPALAGRWAEALATFDVHRQVNGLGLDTRADTVDELSGWLAETGVDPQAWYGVRLFSDGWVPEPVPGPVEDLLAVELEASRRDPYRQLSRLFHVVGRRRRDAP